MGCMDGLAPTFGQGRRRTILIALICVAVIAAILGGTLPRRRREAGHTTASEQTLSTEAYSPAVKGDDVASTLHTDGPSILNSSLATDPIGWSEDVRKANGSSSDVASPAGDKLLGAILDGETPEGDEGTCFAADADELEDAVAEPTCEIIVLTNATEKAYDLDDEIVVNRTVTIMGHPDIMPTIDAGDAHRAFRVTEGVYLELKYMRIMQGGGVKRPAGTAWPNDPGPDRRWRDLQAGGAIAGTTPDSDNVDASGNSGGVHMVIEVRGGSVMLQRGAIGATFVGVNFLAIADSADSVTSALEATSTGLGGRIYGGHVFSAGGNISFFECTFYDYAILVPITDQLVIGGDVLVLAGEAHFTGCTWFNWVWFSESIQIGGNVAVLAGTVIFTATNMQSGAFMQVIVGIGQVHCVLGGIMIITLLRYSSYTAFQLSAGAGGSMFNGAGVMVLTGVTIDNGLAIEDAAGVGFYQCVGAGILVQVGVASAQFTGIGNEDLVGASYFTGTGTSIHVGSPTFISTLNINHNGQADVTYGGMGFLAVISSPTVIFRTSESFIGVGGTFSQPGGMMVYLNNPSFEALPLSFQSGLGGFGFLGTGSAVLGYSPSYGFVALEHSTNTGIEADWWIQGNTNYNKTGIFQYLSGGNGGNTTGESGVKAAQYLPSGILTPPDGSFLLVRDMPIHHNPNLSDPKISAELASFVPENILTAAQKLQSRLHKAVSKALKKAHKKPKKRQGGMYIHDGTDLTCRSCESTPLTGPGAGSCEATEKCSSLPKGHMFSYDDFQLNAQDLLTIDLAISIESGPAPPALLIRDAVRSFVRDQSLASVHVAAFDTEASPNLVQRFYTEASPRTAGADGDPYTHDYRVSFFSTETPSAKALLEAFQNSSSELHQQALESVMAFLQGHADDTTVNDVSASVYRHIIIPSYERKDLLASFGQATSAACGSNSVWVSHEQSDNMPVSQLSAGKAYWVQLRNFKPDTNLAINLIGSTQVDGPLTGQRTIQTAQVVTLLAVTNQDGSASVPWTVPALTQPGRYFLKAFTPGDKVFGLSSSLNVTDKPHSRKLYGPTLYI